jgi:hypothetical protein
MSAVSSLPVSMIFCICLLGVSSLSLFLWFSVFVCQQNLVYLYRNRDKLDTPNKQIQKIIETGKLDTADIQIQKIIETEVN